MTSQNLQKELLKKGKILVKLTPILKIYVKTSLLLFQHKWNCSCKIEAPSVRQDARWEFSLSSDLMCFPRIQSRDFTDVPSDKELNCQVTIKSSLVGEFNYPP